MAKIAVTGGSGEAARAVVADLLAHGHEVLNMQRSSRDLMAGCFPGVPVADSVGEHDTLRGIDKAGRMLGYSPDVTWRELF